MKAYHWNGYWLGIVFLCSVSVVGYANQQDTLSAGEVINQSVKDAFEKLPGRIITDSQQAFLRADNITALLLAGGASLAMHKSDADKNLADNFDGHKGFGCEFADRSLDFIGGPGPQIGLAGIWYMTSLGKQDDLNRQRSWTMISALSVTGIVTTGLKAVVHNKTPNDKSWAWPSGHTASSFAAASVIDEFYGPGIGIPAYGAACLVAWRMMDTGDHWASDVVFGATLGWIVGHTVAGKQKDIEVAGFKVLPYIVTDYGSAAGISFIKQF